MAGPMMRVMEKPMVLSATAFMASVRGTSSNTVLCRAGRSRALQAPISKVNMNRCQTCSQCSASAAPSASAVRADSSWLVSSRMRRS